MSSEKISQQFPGQTLGWGFSLRLSLYFAVVFTIGALGLLFAGMCFMSIVATSNTAVQSIVADRIRGRRPAPAAAAVKDTQLLRLGSSNSSCSA